MPAEPESEKEQDQPSSGDEAVDRMSRAARESLREKSKQFYTTCLPISRRTNIVRLAGGQR